MKTAFVLAALLLLMFSIKSVVGLYFIHRESASLEARMERTFSKVMPGWKAQGGNVQVALIELEGSLSQLKREQSQIGGLPALEMLKDITLHRTRGAVIKEVSMSSGGMIIKGECRTLDDVDAEKSALARTGFFSGVSVLETRNTPGNVVLFTISAKGPASKGK